MRSIYTTGASVLGAVTLAVTFGAGTVQAQSALSGTLRIVSDMSNPGPRAVMEGLAADFDALHPDLSVELTIVDREAWKTQIRNVLSADPPDVVNWYAANRMGPYVDAGLFMDITDWWEAGDFAGLESVRGALSKDGRVWGVPYTYYQWGVYYREDIFAELGLSEPATWDQELANCAVIVASGRACYTIGTRYLWTAGGWFDYLNMRTNGFDFHMALARGEVAWTDLRVRETFANWRKLIDMGAFIEDHQTYSWQEALPFMVKGEAAAYLMGNFAVDQLRNAGLTDAQLDFYQFPIITPGLPQGEDAPTDTFHVAARAQNVEAARAFLKYVTSAEVQTAINGPEGLGQLPVNANASVAEDEFIQQGFAMLSGNAKGGIAQFFDRDWPAEMAAIGMEGLQEFMVFPDNLDDILARLEAARARIYR